eukprot:762523-Hanusia_phi.AAC.5
MLAALPAGCKTKSTAAQRKEKPHSRETGAASVPALNQRLGHQRQVAQVPVQLELGVVPRHKVPCGPASHPPVDLVDGHARLLEAGLAVGHTRRQGRMRRQQVAHHKPTQQAIDHALHPRPIAQPGVKRPGPR